MDGDDGAAHNAIIFISFLDSEYLKSIRFRLSVGPVYIGDPAEIEVSSIWLSFNIIILILL